MSADIAKLKPSEELKSLINEFDTYLKTRKNPTIQETEFVREHLPRFFYFGKIDPKTGEEYEVNLLGWIHGVAGAATQEVDVISHSGEVLFAVPPVMLDRPVGPSRVMYNMYGADVEVSSDSLLSAAAKRLNEGNNIQGNSKIIENVTSHYLTVTASDNDNIRKSYHDRWAVIFSRYGYKSPVTGSANGVVTSNDNDGFEEDVDFI